MKIRLFTAFAVMGLIAAVGDPLADANEAYDNGEYEMAMDIWLSLAGQGNAQVQLRLAEMYSSGEDIPRNAEESVRWYHEAADRGLVDAQLALGMMYSGGFDVHADTVLSYYWFNLAAICSSDKSTQNRAIKMRNSVASEMTSAQIEQAQLLVRDWKPLP